MRAPAWLRQNSEEHMGSSPPNEHEAMDMRGTITIVIVIAVIILIVWFSVFLIFLSRS